MDNAAEMQRKYEEQMAASKKVKNINFMPFCKKTQIFAFSYNSNYLNDFLLFVCSKKSLKISAFPNIISSNFKLFCSKYQKIITGYSFYISKRHIFQEKKFLFFHLNIYS